MKPLYKVGDKVEVVPRVEESFKYRFSFVDGMTFYTGKVVTITSLRSTPSSLDFIPDDEHCYNILEDNGKFDWASSMFRPLPASSISQPSDTPTTIKIKVKTNQLKFNFKN